MVILRIVYGPIEDVKVITLEVGPNEVDVALVVNAATLGEIEFEVDFEDGRTEFGMVLDGQILTNGFYNRGA